MDRTYSSSAQTRSWIAWDIFCEAHRTTAWSGLAITIPLFVVTWASRSSAMLSGYRVVSSMFESEESQTFERKRSLSLQREGLQSLCGMVNATASEVTVAFGIEPNGNVIGVEPGNLDKAQQSLAQAIHSKFEPKLQSRMEVFKIEEKSVILLSAQRNRAVSYHEFEGRAFIREGTITRQLNLNEKQSLELQRNRDLHNGPWKCSGCGSWVGMLSQMVVTNTGVQKTYSCRCGGEFWPAG